MEARLVVVDSSPKSQGPEPFTQLVVSSLDGQCVIRPHNAEDELTQQFSLCANGTLENGDGRVYVASSEVGSAVRISPESNTKFTIDNEGHIFTEVSGMVLGSGFYASQDSGEDSVPPTIVEVENTFDVDMYIMHEVGVGEVAEILVKSDSEVLIFDENKEIIERLENLDVSTTFYVDTMSAVTFANKCDQPVEVYGVNQPIATSVPDIPPNENAAIKTREGSVYEAYIGKQAMMFVDPITNKIAFRATISKANALFDIKAPPRVTVCNRTSSAVLVKTSFHAAPEIVIPATEARTFTVTPNTQLNARSASKTKVIFCSERLFLKEVTVGFTNETYIIEEEPEKPQLQAHEKYVAEIREQMKEQERAHKQQITQMQQQLPQKEQFNNWAINQEQARRQELTKMHDKAQEYERERRSELDKIRQRAKEQEIALWNELEKNRNKAQGFPEYEQMRLQAQEHATKRQQDRVERQRKNMERDQVRREDLERIRTKAKEEGLESEQVLKLEFEWDRKRADEIREEQKEEIRQEQDRNREIASENQMSMEWDRKRIKETLRYELEWDKRRFAVIQNNQETEWEQRRHRERRQEDLLEVVWDQTRHRERTLENELTKKLI